MRIKRLFILFFVKNRKVDIFGVFLHVTKDQNIPLMSISMSLGLRFAENMVGKRKGADF